MAIDQFEILRRAANERGMCDYERAVEEARHTGKAPRRNNPHQNNYATDERVAWDEGWSNAHELALEDRHAEHVKANYNVARLAGGNVNHLRKIGAPAICGAQPRSTTKMGFARAGWHTYKQAGVMRASCWKCIDAFRPLAEKNEHWPFPQAKGGEL